MPIICEQIFLYALCTGITVAIFVSSGKTHELKYKLQMYTKGFEIDLMVLLIMFMLIPSYQVYCFCSHSCTIMVVSYSSVSNKNMELVTCAFM